MTEFLQNLRNNGGKIGQVLKRFNSVLRMTQASAGNATAACVSAAAAAAYQARLSKENFMELAGHIYDAEKGPKVTRKGFAPLAEPIPIRQLDIVFTQRPGGPGEPAEFVEVEDADGKGVSLQWHGRPDGTVALRIRAVGV